MKKSIKRVIKRIRWKLIIWQYSWNTRGQYQKHYNNVHEMVRDDEDKEMGEMINKRYFS
jgi:hypothetical protein